jgi:hypothetical protein
MNKIEIYQIGDDQYKVEVSSMGHRTMHEVSLSDGYWHKLVDGKISKKDLLQKTFEFLLERERNTDILESFPLEKITQYFPDFERNIRDEIQE